MVSDICCQWLEELEHECNSRLEVRIETDNVLALIKAYHQQQKVIEVLREGIEAMVCGCDYDTKTLPEYIKKYPDGGEPIIKTCYRCQCLQKADKIGAGIDV